MDESADEQAWLAVSEDLEAVWMQAQQQVDHESAMTGLAIFAALAVRNACDGDLEQAIATFCEEVAGHAKALFHPDGRPRADFTPPPVQ